MGVNNLFSLHAVTYGSAGGSMVDGIVDQRFSKNTQHYMDDADGQVNPKFIATGAQESLVRFSTQSLARAIGGFGIAGFAIASNPVQFNFQAYTANGRRVAIGTTSHRRLSVNSGLIVPRRLSANQDDKAVLEYECIPAYDGSNDPVAASSGVALTGAPAGDQLYTVGPVSINGAALSGVKSIDVDFGIDVIQERGDGEPWAKFVAIRREAPVIRIRSVDLTYLATYGYAGTAQGSTDSVVYFSALAQGGGISGGSDHISLTIDHGKITMEEAGGPSPGVGELLVTITPAYDGTNAILVASTTATLP